MNTPMQSAQDKLLFTPGPLTTSLTVKQAMLHDAGSWDAEFNSLVANLRGRLVLLAGLQPEEGWEAVHLQVSGTYGVEAVFQTCVPATGKVAVLTNGAYGKRMVQMLQHAAIDYAMLRTPEDSPVQPEMLSNLLSLDPTITHVAVVHCETTTGLLNPIEALGEVAKSHHKTYIVDAMSSFGGIPIDLEACGVDFLVSSPNKCLEGVPGFCIVLCRRQVLEQCEGYARSLSLDLLAQLNGFDTSRTKTGRSAPDYRHKGFNENVNMRLTCCERSMIRPRHTALHVVLMKQLIQLFTVLAHCVCVVGCRSAVSPPALAADRSGISATPGTELKSSTNAAPQDDLRWLVGRWRCYGRECLKMRDWPLGPRCEDTLEYFNVYFPFADEDLTLALTDDPKNRPIAAEFLVLELRWDPAVKEHLVKMEPGGLIQIGKDRILVGESPFEYYEFHYHLERTGKGLWLILESRVMRLRLFKWSDAVGDIKQSFVTAPIRDYSSERISALAREYEKLNGQFRYTPPTHTLLALNQALNELDCEGGIAARAARYRRNHQVLLEGMRGLGLRPYLRPEVQSYIITAFHYPQLPGFSFQTLYRKLSQQGFLIYPGKLSEADTFRIGTIGHLFPGNLEALVEAVGAALGEMEVRQPRSVMA